MPEEPASSLTYGENIMDDYKAALRKALDRTQKWTLDTRNCVMLDQYLVGDLDEKASREALVRFSRDFMFDVEQRAGQCAAVHLMALAAFYDMRMPAPPVLTIGDVLVDGVARYKVTRQGLRRHIREGRGAGGIIRAHMWLTFPEFMILDLTLLPAMVGEAGEPLDINRPDGLAVIGQPQELKPRLVYKPMLVGEGFVKATGTIQPFGEAMFTESFECWMDEVVRR